MRATHRKRGTVYGVYATNATLQTDALLGDDAQLVVYIDKDGKVWARPTNEFYDGRFDIKETHPVFHEAHGGIVADSAHNEVVSINIQGLTTSQSEALMTVILEALNSHPELDEVNKTSGIRNVILRPVDGDYPVKR